MPGTHANHAYWYIDTGFAPPLWLTLPGSGASHLDKDLPTATATVTTPITGRLTLLFAVAVGIIVTNLFAPQTLVGMIGGSLGLSQSQQGLVAMAPLAGYAAGLLLLVPLADRLENRALVLRLLLIAIIAASLCSVAPNAPLLLVALVVLGLSCSAIQVLVPLAASMAPAAQRGRTIGNVMSGLMFGILLSRPMASLIADLYQWRAFYLCNATLMLLLWAALYRALPRRHPGNPQRYPALLLSLWELLREQPVLRQRALTAALVMATFSLFWTTVALRLVRPPFQLDYKEVALFALVGVTGALATPWFGRLGDRGGTRPGTVASHLMVIAAFLIAARAGNGALPFWPGLGLLAFSAVLLDVGVTGDQTLGRRVINLIEPDSVRGRINALFVGLFFVGGALGSALSGLAWAHGGWSLTCLLGAGLALTALVAQARQR